MSEITLQFLNSVLPPEGDYWYVAAIFERHGDQKARVTHRWHRTRLQLAACLLEADGQGRESYFACSVFGERAKGRKGENAVGTGSLWAELDAGKGKQYETADSAQDAILEFCRHNGIPPPLLVSSGKGLHCFWPFQVLLDIETWRRYSTGLNDALRVSGIKNERKDAASILRVPGTHNRKYGTPIFVTLRRQAGPYELKQFEEILYVNNQQQYSRTYVNGARVAEKLASINVSKPRFSSRILRNCGQICHPATDERGYVPEPIWHLALGVFAFVEGDGDDAAHDWSAEDDRYDRQQTQGRLDRLRAVTSGATTCERFHEANPATCEACPFWEKIKSPIALCTSKQTPTTTERSALRGLELPAVPAPFQWRASSLCLVHESNKGDDVEVVVSEHPIYLASIRNKETRDGYAYHYRQLIPVEGWKDIVVAATELYSGGGKGALHKGGANITDYPAFLKYTTAAINMRYTNNEKVEPLYEQFGWKSNDTEFLYGLSLYTKDGKRRIIGDKNVTTRTGASNQVWVGPCPGGSLAVWADAANRLFAPGTEAQSFAICAAFGAIFQHFLVRSEGGSIISLVTHQTGRGKSTAMAGGYTVWGQKLGFGIEKIDSSISKGATLGSIGNLPLFHDQFQTTDPVKVMEFVDLFTNGRDKRRMNREGEMADAGLQWQTTLFCASNASLVDSIESLGNPALAARIWEMSTDLPQHLEELYTGDQLKIQLEENAGYAGDAFLAKLMSGNNIKTARDELKKWHDLIEQRSGLGAEGRFWIRLGATAAVASMIVAGSILNFHPPRIMEWFEKELKSRVEGLPSEEDWPVEALGRFINEHSSCQLGVEAPFFPGDANVQVHIKPTRDLLIRRERRGGRVYISRDGLRRWCVKKGINMREMVQTLDNLGVIIDKYKNVTLGAGTDYAGVRVSTIAIDGYHKALGGLFQSADVIPFERRDQYSAGEDTPF